MTYYFGNPATCICNPVFLIDIIERYVQPAFAYKPHLDFGEKVWGKSISDVLTTFIKSDFTLV